MRKPEKAFLTILLILFLYFLGQLAGTMVAWIGTNWHAIVGMQHPSKSIHFTTFWLGICLLAANVLTIVFLLLLTPIIDPLFFHKLKARFPYLRKAGILMGFMLMSMGVNMFFSVFSLNDGNTTELFREMSHSWWMLTCLCLIGPFAEEITFRVGILQQLKKMGASTFWAVLLSSLLFALAHGNFQQMLPAFFMGAALGYIFALSGNNMQISFIAHACNNISAVTMFYFPSFESHMEMQSPGARLTGGLIMAGFGVVALIALLRKIKIKQT